MNEDLFEELARAHENGGAAFPYVLEGVLGSGGMGVVYRVRHPDDGVVALKLMRPEVAVDQALRTIFRREIETMEQLRHPNIVRMLRSGCAGGMFFVTMELCSGGNAADVASRRGGKLRVDECLAIARDATAGLAHVHANGFVHRDIKPENILLDGEGRAKIADLGLAKNSEFAGRSGITRPGQWAGTPAFMARDQYINFKYVKPAADVFSMGATIYHLLTGTFPREAPRGSASVKQVLDAESVPIRTRDPSVPAELAAIIDRALSRLPDGRFPSAVELHAALLALGR